MNPPPTNLIDSVPGEFQEGVQAWWEGLPEEDRGQIERLCDARREIFLFETFYAGEAASSESGGPKVTGGKFLPHDDATGFDEWGEDYFQHLLNHPELVIVWDAEQGRVFHICSRHPAARQCLAGGGVDASFVCPFNAERCYMHVLRGERSAVRWRPMQPAASCG